MNPAGTSLTQQEAFPHAHTEHTSDIAIYNSNLDVNQGKLFRLQLRVLQIVMTESGFSNKFPDIVMVALFVYNGVNANKNSLNIFLCIFADIPFAFDWLE